MDYEAEGIGACDPEVYQRKPGEVLERTGEINLKYLTIRE